MSKKHQLRLTLALVTAFGVAAFLVPGSATVAKSGVGNQVLRRALAIETGQAKPTGKYIPISGGVMSTLMQATRPQRAGALEVPAAPLKKGSQGCRNVYHGPVKNVRVNQDCSLRRQAETVVAINPTNPDNVVAGQNDSRIGFNHCGYDFSFDGGKTWGDQNPPFWQFLALDGHTFDACSDPTATFDAEGNAYVGGVLFDVASTASAFVVAKSNAGIGGAFYHSPDSSIAFQEYSDVPLGVVASDDDPAVFNDKEFIVADAHPGSPKVNNVYATWTRFSLVNSPIYFSQSTDGGATWSAGVEISGNNPDICTDFSIVFGACDQDQGSHPIVGPDGTIHVAFGNGNTPEFGINQVIYVSCPGTADCTDSANWTAPVKVNDLVGTHPIANSSNVEGCPIGRQCLPPNGYRVPEFTSISLSMDSSDNLFATWADFRNGGPPCDTLDFATSDPPCDNDVFYASSTDGGATWSEAHQLTAVGSAQWQPWSAVAENGKLFVAYYDRQYGDCEFSGCNDITRTRVTDPASESPVMDHERLTTSSMPNLTTLTNPVQAGFLGDYMWVATVGNTAYVIWADTRGRGGAVEEDVYLAVTG
jgi:hypothetical protein